MTIVQALTALGFAASNKEARRKVEEGAVRFNDTLVTDAAQGVTEGKVSLGRKKHGLLIR
jgi:tyrosyl-tRNA synthetase